MFTFGPAFVQSHTAAKDPYFASTTLLCHMDGSNGSVAAPDATGKHATLMYGAAGTCISTTQSKFGGSSFYSGAATDAAVRVSAPTTDFNFGSGQFTLECFAYWTSHSSTLTETLLSQYGGSADLGWSFRVIGANILFTYSTNGTATASVSATWTPTLNTWYHLAVDRDAAGTIRICVNGAVVASAAGAVAFYASSQLVRIGNDNNDGRNLPGYIDEVRITKGVARYAGAFTPPIAAFPNS